METCAFKSFSIGVSLVFLAPGVRRFQNYFSEYMDICAHVCACLLFPTGGESYENMM